MEIRRPIARLAAAWFCAMAGWAGVAQASDRVYVLCQTGAALTEIAGDKIAATVVLDKAPAAFVLSPDEREAYVTHPDLGKVSIVDLATHTVSRTFAVPGSPFGIAISRDGRLFVGDWNGAHVSVLKVDGTPITTIEVGKAPAHLLLTSDDSVLIVANRESDSVSLVETSTLSPGVAIGVGRAPFAMALAPDGTQLYVGNVQGGTVSVLDMKTRKISATWPSGSMPYGAAVTPDGGRVLVTNQQASTLSLIDRDGGGKTAIKVGGYPEGVAISADGRTAYVANWFSDDLSVIDLTTSSQIRRVKTPGGPRGVAIVQSKP